VRQKTTADKAIDLASRTFARSSLPVTCEVEALTDIDARMPDECDQPGSWLALYTMDGQPDWNTTFLCRRCKKELQDRMKGNPAEDYPNIIFVKDWRTLGESEEFDE